MSQSNKPISPLRQRMLQDMAMRKFNPSLDFTDNKRIKNKQVAFGSGPLWHYTFVFFRSAIRRWFFRHSPAEQKCPGHRLLLSGGVLRASSCARERFYRLLA